MYNNHQINIHIAKQTMSLRASYGGVRTLLTVWKGNTMLITWNRANDCMMFDPVPNYLDAQLTEEDELILSKLVKDYLVHTEQKIN